MSKRSNTDINHLSKLANLPLSQKELISLSTDLKDILGYVDEIKQLDLEGFSPIAQVTLKTNQWRYDKITPSLTQKQALSQSKNTHHGYFLVPSILSND